MDRVRDKFGRTAIDKGLGLPVSDDESEPGTEK
jgi:hypothetical protein